jgi:hypothetical protein
MDTVEVAGPDLGGLRTAHSAAQIAMIAQAEIKLNHRVVAGAIL